MPFGDEWARHRRLLSVLFTENYLKKYTNVIAAKSLLLVRKWKRQLMQAKDLNKSHRMTESTIPSQSLIDVTVNLTKTALDIIGSTGFGTEFNSLDLEPSPYEAAGYLKSFYVLGFCLF